MLKREKKKPKKPSRNIEFLHFHNSVQIKFLFFYFSFYKYFFIITTYKVLNIEIPA